MKVTLNWLKEFVEIDCDAQELARRLTHAGLEVESVTSIGNIPASVLTVQIEKIEKHPQADRLSLCTVSLGNESRQIVCGAKNMKEGDKVALAPPGTALPDGKKIEKAKIRGIESAGMLCSETELGLAKESSGLLILPAEIPIGKSLIDVLPISDTVFEINVTPNRSDCLSVIGIAREIAALFGTNVKPYSFHLPTGNFSIKDHLRVEVPSSSSELCPRYTAQMIQNVQIKPSPLSVQKRLELVGLRSINNIVDATNYVMIETGQPLHAFDYDQIQGKILKISTPAQKTKIKTLDQIEREVDSQDLLIQDERHPLAIAGVMGGFDSGVSDKTKNLVLESAYFNPISVRKTSKRLGLGSESSFRFERGTDPNGVKLALERLADLILQWGGGEISKDLIDTAQKEFPSQKVLLRSSRIETVLGISYEDKKIELALQGLGLSIQKKKEGWECTIPTFRKDLEREIDLIEEVARIVGYQEIPTELPQGIFHLAKEEEGKEIEDQLRSYLKSVGFFETIHYSFCSKKELSKTGLSTSNLIELANPLSEEMEVMRSSLVPSLLTSIQKNLAKQNKDFKFYEIRSIYKKTSNQNFDQILSLGLASVGSRYGKHWGFPKEESDFYDLKGNIELIFKQLQIDPLDFVPSQQPYLHPGLSADIVFEKTVLGSFGVLHPEVALNFEIENSVIIGEIDLHQSLKYKKEKKEFKSLAKFPSIERDLTLVVPEDLQNQRILDEIRKMSILNLQETRLIDLYAGKPIPSGKKALTYSFRYQDETRTLTDEEVNSIHTKLVEQLKAVLPIEWR